VREGGATHVETWNATLACPGVATTRVLEESRADLDVLVVELKKLGVEMSAPTHCSGDLTRLAFSYGYGEKYLEWG